MMSLVTCLRDMHDSYEFCLDHFTVITTSFLWRNLNDLHVQEVSQQKLHCTFLNLKSSTNLINLQLIMCMVEWKKFHLHVDVLYISKCTLYL